MKTILNLSKNLAVLATILLVAFSMQAAPNPQLEAPAGGILVIAQGLVNHDLEVEFTSSNYKMDIQKIKATVKDASGKVIYATSTKSTLIQFPSLNLSPGPYFLEINLNGINQSVDFLVI